jgi:hypothetical protein
MGGVCDTLAQKKSFKTEPLSLNNLDAFTSPPANWKIAGDATGTYLDASAKTSKGTGVLYNDFQDKIRFKEEANLSTKLQHGDMFLSLDFLLPKGSNAGIYFQGRYEIQLFDSWKSTTLHTSDCGSIYERWDDSKPEGAKGFEGHPPRVNASFAPNVWQHLEVEFEAPRFDASGKKTAPARFAKVTLNGMVLHENVVVNGPTRSAAFRDEKSTGPMVIQGDHGPVALRNIQYALLNDFSVVLKDLQYTYYEGHFPDDFAALTPGKITRTGKVERIDARLAESPNASALIFSGKITLPETDNYQFILQRFGFMSLSIDQEEIIKAGEYFGEETATRKLSKGDHILQLRYIKNFSWTPPGIGLFIGRANARPFPLHVAASLPFVQPEPLIRVPVAQEPEVIRSFMWHQGKKKTHVLSVGTPERINFSYNLDQAGILKFWRGDFLNVTDMWYERGEPQTAAPMGAVVAWSGKAPLLTGSGSPSDSAAIAYKGYTLNAKGIPVFTYQYGQATLEDIIRPAATGEGLTRTLTWKGTPASPISFVLAEGGHITQPEKNVFSVDQQFYIRVSGDGKISPEVKTLNGKQSLIWPQTAPTVEYTIIW